MMASKTVSRVTHRLESGLRIKGGRPQFVCSRCLRQRAFSTGKIYREEMNGDQGERSRWQQTPKAMAMPFRTRLRARPRPTQEEMEGITDPIELQKRKHEKLNNAYVSILGQGGEVMLPEEVKWVAVTHKSFDHGRRGSNDRLAFLGTEHRVTHRTLRRV